MWWLTRKIVTGSFLSSGQTIDYRYNPKSDTLWLLIGDEPVAYTRETMFGLIDFDADDNLVAIEVFAASGVLGDLAAFEAKLQEPETGEGQDISQDLMNRATGYVSEARDHVKIA
jgi:uncharacterized protein YuzE